jgi:hypothetical protein
MPTMTKKIFRLINESRSACVRLACVAYEENKQEPNKESFYQIVAIIAKEIKSKHKLTGHIALGSLRSNQWRFGKWKKIPAHERNVQAYFKLHEAEEECQLINPDEVADQERKAARKERFNPFMHSEKHLKKTPHRDLVMKKRCGTDTCVDIINGDKGYCMRLRDMAGEDMRSKHNFVEEVMDIIDELKPPHMYANTIAMRLWKHGQWKHYLFEAPRDNDLELNRVERGQWYKDFKETQFDDKADALSYAMKAMPFPMRQKITMPPLSSYDFMVKCKDELVIGEFKTSQMHDETIMEQAQSRMHRQGCYAKNSINHSLYPYQKHMMELIHKVDAAELERRVLTSLPRRFGMSDMMNAAYGSKLHKMFEDYFTCNPNPRPKEEYRMEIKTQTLINGLTLDNLSNQELISMIANTENEIRALEKLETKSDHIDNQIKTHKTSCTQLAGFLDDRSTT